MILGLGVTHRVVPQTGDIIPGSTQLPGLIAFDRHTTAMASTPHHGDQLRLARLFRSISARSGNGTDIFGLSQSEGWRGAQSEPSSSVGCHPDIDAVSASSHTPRTGPRIWDHGDMSTILADDHAGTVSVLPRSRYCPIASAPLATTDLAVLAAGAR